MWVCKKCNAKIMDKDVLEFEKEPFCPVCGEWLNVRLSYSTRTGPMQSFVVEPDVWHKFRHKNYYQLTEVLDVK